MQTIGTGFNGPYGLFVDAGGNVFVADTNNNAIKEVVAADGYATINTLATGLDWPWSVVVNAAGDLFVAEGGDQCHQWIPGECDNINTSVVQIPAAGGYKTVNTLGSGVFGKPLGVAIDGVGNVYESDFGNGCAGEWTAGSGIRYHRELVYAVHVPGLRRDWRGEQWRSHLRGCDQRQGLSDGIQHPACDPLQDSHS